MLKKFCLFYLLWCKACCSLFLNFQVLLFWFQLQEYMGGNTEIYMVSDILDLGFGGESEVKCFLFTKGESG